MPDYLSLDYLVGWLRVTEDQIRSDGRATLGQADLVELKRLVELLQGAIRERRGPSA